MLYYLHLKTVFHSMKHKLVEKILSSWIFLKKQRKYLFVFALFAILTSIIWAVLPVGDFANAQATPPAPAPAAAPATAPAQGIQGTTKLEDPGFWVTLLSTIILSIARLCLSLTLFVLTFVIQLAGYNGYLDSSAVTVGWVMVRDITNMAFVVILLVIAFGTILGLEKYEWKKMLVKLAMAAVLVNFSRTICGVFIDIAQVVMVTFVNGIAATAGGNLIQMFNLDKIRDLSASTSSNPAAVNDFNIFLSSLMAVTFSAMVLFTLAVFLFMLIARMIVLWVLIVLSPLAFVFSVLPQTEQYANQWWSEFGKNVITGPVLLFFIWLAFVTAGNGKVNEEIVRGSVTAAASGDEADALAGGTSGIGAVGDWNNIANFAIAIGLMMVGARAAAQLGGIGGDWAGNAVDAGKKFGMYAGGVMAARYALNKGAEKGREGLEMAGGKLAKPFTRFGETQKNKLKVKLGKWDENRNEQAAALEKAGEARQELKKLDAKRATMAPLTENESLEYDKHLKTLEKAGRFGSNNSFVRGIATSLIETGGRKDKRVEDIQKAAEAQEKIVEETYSTSNSWQGKMKLDLGVRAKQIEDFAAAKRDQKYSEAQAKYLDGAGGERYLERDAVITQAKVKAEKAESKIQALGIEGTLNEERLAGLAKTKAKTENLEVAAQAERERRELDAQKAVGTFGAKARSESVQAQVEAERVRETLEAQKTAGTLKSKARAEHETMMTGGERERVIASARDEHLRALNMASFATNEQKVLEKQAKAKIDAQTVGDFVVARERTLAQLRRIQAAKQSGDTAAIEELGRGLVEMQIGNLDRHAAYAEGTMGSILSALKSEDASIPLEASMDLDPKALAKLLSQKLTGILGKKITTTNMQDEWVKIPEELRAQIRLEAEKAAGQGSVGLAGLFNIRTDNDGNQETILTDFNSKDGIKHVKARRESAMSGSKITSLSGFSGSMDKNSGGDAIVDSKESVDIAVQLIAPVSGNILSSIDEYVKADLASILQNSDTAKYQELLSRLEASSKDNRGLAGMLQFAAERMEDGLRKQEVENRARQLTQRSTQPGAGSTPKP